MLFAVFTRGHAIAQYRIVITARVLGHDTGEQRHIAFGSEPLKVGHVGRYLFWAQRHRRLGPEHQIDIRKVA